MDELEVPDLGAKVSVVHGGSGLGPGLGYQVPRPKLVRPNKSRRQVRRDKQVRRDTSIFDPVLS